VDTLLLLDLRRLLRAVAARRSEATVRRFGRSTCWLDWSSGSVTSLRLKPPCRFPGKRIGGLDWLADPQIWISLLSLTALEIVLGIDNLIFIAILANKLPERQRDRARKLGLALALFMRLALLASISWLVGLTDPLFSVAGHAFSWRSLLLIGGGLFLVYKGTSEIHERVEGGQKLIGAATDAKVTFTAVITQIILLDVVFSLDSVITAIGMVNQLWVMATAVVISVMLMLAVLGPLSAFVQQHPTVKMLALSFLLMIGMVLVADGFDVHVPKGYVYAAMGFSVAVECLNLLVSSRRKMAEAQERGTRDDNPRPAGES
jgi:predicted tellurium resistance membrane protein TerC